MGYLANCGKKGSKMSDEDDGDCGVLNRREFAAHKRGLGPPELGTGFED
jgi:hypothetical protein